MILPGSFLLSITEKQGAAMKKTAARIFLAFAVILCGIYAFFYLTQERSDFSQYKNLGKSYQVQILRDTWGVPHVFGKSDPDVAFGLAYAHAEDDFRTIQGVLLAVRGKLATLIGPGGGPNDYMVNLLRHWDYVNAGYNKDIDEKTRSICEAYADGINFYASLHPDEVATSLKPVQGKDIVAGFVHKVPLFFGLDKTLKELFSDEKKNDKDEANGKTDAVVNQFRLTASNTFAVSPKRSTEGQTFLAVNSHQPWEGAVTWYEAHLHSEEGWDMVGGLFPGSPVILHGHNRDLGWAHTVNAPDLQDVFVLEINPEDPDQYLFDGEWKTLEKREARITAKIFGPVRWTVTKETLWSVYGPVVRLPHGTFALRFASMGDIRQVMQWYRMNRARDINEWLSAMSMQAVPCFNCGYADRRGNIAYLYNARLPYRKEGFDWKRRVPGNTSGTLWSSYYPFSKSPLVKNPMSGFIQNCNSSPFRTTTGPGNPVPGNYTSSMDINTNMTNRALRALELFGSDPVITRKDFLRYKYDMSYSDKSKMAEITGRFITSPAGKDPVLQKAREILSAWDLSTAPENRGAALAVFTYMAIRDGHKDFGDITDEEIKDEVKKAALLLKKHHGRIDVPWKRVNRLIRGETDLGMGGGPDILHAVEGVHTGDGRLRGKQGDSYILIVTWDSKGMVSSRSIHQYGSSTTDRDSPHYDDQAALFVKRELKPVWLDEEDIRANLEAEYAPGNEK